MEKIRRRGLYLVGIIWLLTSMVFAEVKDLSYKDGEISYVLTKPDNITIQLFTQTGEFVTTIFAGSQKEGKYSIFWEGEDSEGNSIKKGEYILKIKRGRKATKDIEFADKKGFIQFGNPSDVEIDKKGDIYVLDRGKHKIYKFHSDGSEAPDFKPIELEEESQNYFNLQGNGHWMAISDERIFYGSGKKHYVRVHNKKGKYLYSIGGWRPKPIEPGDKTREGKRGIYWGHTGGALGPGNKLYVRNREGAEVKVFDREKAGGAGWLFTAHKDMLYAPITWLYVGPSMVSDGKGKIYMTDYKKGIRRYDDKGKEIVFRYKYPKSLNDPIGMALDREGMVYVAARGNSEVVQLWDSGESLSFVCSFKDSSIKGLRDVAISRDGKSIYLLEDKDNIHSIQGKGRLFKYNFSYSQVLEKKINW